MAQPDNSAVDFPAVEFPAVEFIGFWYRLGAAILDLLIEAALAAALIGVVVGDQLNTEHGRPMAAVLAILVVPAYLLSCWLLVGRTPGKWACSARIVDFRSGNRPRVWQFLLRFFGYLISAGPMLAGFFWVIGERHKRGWHDRLAKTAVIGDDSLRAPDSDEIAESPYCIQVPPWHAN